MTRPALAAIAAVLLLAAAPAAAVPMLSIDPDRSLGAVYRLLDSQRVAEAEALLAAAPGDPGQPGRLFLKGLAHFYRGDYAASLAVMDGISPELLHPADRGLIGFIRETAGSVAPLGTVAGEHFTLRLDRERDWVLESQALAVLERARALLGEILGIVPAEPVRVEIFADPDSFQKASSLTVKDIENSGAIGICKFNKIMVLSPRCLAFGYRWLDTLVHEYVHYLLISLTDNKAPIWIHEGTAKYFDTRWKGTPERVLWPSGESFLAAALERDELIPFSAMDPSLVKIEGAERVDLAYAECAAAVEFIISGHGVDGLRRILAGIRERLPGGTADALEAVTGRDYAAFGEAWKEWLRQKGLKRDERARVRRTLLADGGADEERLFDEIRSQAARNHVRLGDTLRRGGRLRPALIEYQKALRETPEAVALLNRVGVTASELGEAALASDSFRRALAAFPDHPATYLNMGDDRRRRGETTGAARLYAEYTEINPFNPEAWRRLGDAALEAGDRPRALDALERALRFRPGDVGLRETIERLKTNLNRSGG
jgi:tetratricopeptide (TPR) repeat protein